MIRVLFSLQQSRMNKTYTHFLIIDALFRKQFEHHFGSDTGQCHSRHFISTSSTSESILLLVLVWFDFLLISSFNESKSWFAVAFFILCCCWWWGVDSWPSLDTLHLPVLCFEVLGRYELGFNRANAIPGHSTSPLSPNIRDTAVISFSLFDKGPCSIVNGKTCKKNFG